MKGGSARLGLARPGLARLVGIGFLYCYPYSYMCLTPVVTVAEPSRAEPGRPLADPSRVFSDKGGAPRRGLGKGRLVRLMDGSAWFGSAKGGSANGRLGSVPFGSATCDPAKGGDYARLSGIELARLRVVSARVCSAKGGSANGRLGSARLG